MSGSSAERNKAHYDKAYGYLDISLNAAKLRDPEAFLADAARTDTSWHGLYGIDPEFASRLEGARVLELGAGDGLNAILMSRLRAQVTAVDISEETPRAIAKTLSLLQGPAPAVNAMAGDLLQLDFPRASFDFVVGKEFLHHLDHNIEEQYLRRIADVLKDTGEARFVEPAVNSRLLDTIRWCIPVPGRPSSLLTPRRFRDWKASDPHPLRDDSSCHYLQIGRRFFQSVEAKTYGGLERIHRLLPNGTMNRAFRRFAHKAERLIPRFIERPFARHQLLVFLRPIRR